MDGERICRTKQVQRSKMVLFCGFVSSLCTSLQCSGKHASVAQLSPLLAMMFPSPQCVTKPMCQVTALSTRVDSVQQGFLQCNLILETDSPRHRDKLRSKHPNYCAKKYGCSVGDMDTLQFQYQKWKIKYTISRLSFTAVFWINGKCFNWLCVIDMRGCQCLVRIMQVAHVGR